MAARVPRITCDTSVVIDGLRRERVAAIQILAAARAGLIDIAFAGRLCDELRTFTLDEVEAAIGGEPALITTPWRLGFGMLGVDTMLGGGVGEISTPTLEPIGRLTAFDSDHLEAHRRSGREVFVTSDRDLLGEARRRGLEAATPEEVVARIGPVDE